MLSNSRARNDNDAEKTARTEMIAAIEQNGAAILPDRMLHRLLQPNPNADVVRTVRGMIERANAAASAYAVMAMRDRMDFSSLLHRIQHPTMVVPVKMTPLSEWKMLKPSPTAFQERGS